MYESKSIKFDITIKHNEFVLCWKKKLRKTTEGEIVSKLLTGNVLFPYKTIQIFNHGDISSFFCQYVFYHTCNPWEEVGVGIPCSCIKNVGSKINIKQCSDLSVICLVNMYQAFQQMIVLPPLQLQTAYLWQHLLLKTTRPWNLLQYKTPN